MSKVTRRWSPYQGLVPYSEDDAPYFFGREDEREIIAANLLASRLTLLYGTSGVGKSSVLHAGVVHDLAQRARRSLEELGAPEFAVVVFDAWRDDPVAGLAEAAGRAVERALGHEVQDRPSRSSSLVDNLKACAEPLDGGLLIILDQFEDYFLYHAREEGDGTFAVEFPRAVRSRDLRASFLVSLREDALARLDRFKERIPGLFGNYLRVEHLAADAARAAIVKPVEQYNRENVADGQGITVEPSLVDAVLREVVADRRYWGQVGRVVSLSPSSLTADARIDTAYLQVVMMRLWDEEMRAGSRVLRLETLERLGGVERIVHQHLDAVMGVLNPKEREVAAAAFDYLVTQSGTKIAHTVPDLSHWTRSPELSLALVLDKLAQGSSRILRTVEPPADQPGAVRYEIFHDVLAPAVLDWRRRYLREAGLRRQRLVGIAVMAALAVISVVIVAGVAVYANAQQAEAKRQAQGAVALSLNTLLIVPTGTTGPTAEAVRLTAVAVGTSAAQVALPPPTVTPIVARSAAQTMPDTPTLAPPAAGAVITEVLPSATPVPTVMAAPVATPVPTNPPSPVPTSTPSPPPPTTPTLARPPDPMPGTRIVFTSNRQRGAHHLFAMNLDGSGQSPLPLNVPDSVTEYQPDYSANQRLVAFFAAFRLPGGGLQQDIFSAKLDGSGLRRLTIQQFDNWNPVWSPDGSRLAFVTSRNGNSQIYVMGSDGRPDTQVRVAASSARDDQPSWSPDARHLVFVRSQGTDQHLYVVDLQGSEVRPLTSGFFRDSHPWWSPSGRTIVFARATDTNGDGVLSDQDISNIWTMSADGSNLRDLTNWAADEDDPTVSADGNWIAFTRWTGEGKTDIYTMTLSGGYPTRLTSDPADDSHPIWVAP